MAENDPNKNISRKTLNFNEIIPLGYPSESLIFDLRNADFKLKSNKIPH